MIVMCQVAGCPFLSGAGFCRQNVLQIRAQGGCGYLYKKNGQINPRFQEPVDEQYKANINVFNYQE